MHLYELLACFALLSSVLVCVVLHPFLEVRGIYKGFGFGLALFWLGICTRDGSNWGGGPSLPPPCCDEASRYASQKKPGHRLSHAGYQEAAAHRFQRSIQCKPLHSSRFKFVFCWCTRVLIHCHCAPGFLFTVTITVTVSTTFLITDSDGA